MFSFVQTFTTNNFVLLLRILTAAQDNTVAVWNSVVCLQISHEF